MHTDSTLQILDEMTKDIGAEFRAFANKTCSAFETRELDREMEARKHRQLKKAQVQHASNNPSAPNPQMASNMQPAPGDATQSAGGSTPEGGKRRRKFNLKTYKYHSLGDYVGTIRQLGTSDSYSTEPESYNCWVLLNLMLTLGSLLG
jgi:hypothetical protein